MRKMRRHQAGSGLTCTGKDAACQRALHHLRHPTRSAQTLPSQAAWQTRPGHAPSPLPALPSPAAGTGPAQPGPACCSACAGWQARRWTGCAAWTARSPLPWLPVQHPAAAAAQPLARGPLILHNSARLLWSGGWGVARSTVLCSDVEVQYASYDTGEVAENHGVLFFSHLRARTFCEAVLPSLLS